MAMRELLEDNSLRNNLQNFGTSDIFPYAFRVSVKSIGLFNVYISSVKKLCKINYSILLQSCAM